MGESVLFLCKKACKINKNHPFRTKNHPGWVSKICSVFPMIKLRKTTFQKTRHMTEGGRTMITYRVLLAEDRAIYRLYFENMLRNSSRYILIGTEETMEEAVQRCAHTAVDLILTAATDREGNTNFAAVADCKREYSTVRIVMITDTPEHTYLQQAEECGVDSFWYAEDAKQSILSVLDRTMEGKSIFPAHLPSVKIGQMDSRRLTEKELLILREVAKGYSNKEIAENLQMSYYTVRDYVKGMLEKTALQSRTALAVAVVSSGLIVLGKKIQKPVK